jgi:anti-sigma factor RsiW
MTTPGMDCRDLVEMVTDYLEARLPPTEAERFEAHMAACDGCDAYLRQIRMVMHLAGRERSQELPRMVQPLLPAFRTFRRGLV